LLNLRWRLRACLPQFKPIPPNGHGVSLHPAEFRAVDVERIEDGQFVGWLSYPDVVRAMLAFEALKDVLSFHGFQVKLHTRDELIPQEWVET